RPTAAAPRTGSGRDGAARAPASRARSRPSRNAGAPRARAPRADAAARPARGSGRGGSPQSRPPSSRSARGRPGSRRGSRRPGRSTPETWSRRPRPGLPAVRLGRLAARAGPDLVEPREGVRGKLEVQRAERAGELLHGPRTDDRRRHRRLAEEPGEGDVRGRVAQLAAEALVGVQLRTPFLDAPPDAVAPAAALRDPRARAAEQPARERAPRDDADPERPARRDQLELDRPRGEVVEALLGDEPEEVTRRGRRLRHGDVPGREVAAPDVEDLALRHQLLQRLPDLVPR